MASPSNETDAILESFSAPPSRQRPVQPEQPDTAAITHSESKPEAATDVSTEGSISGKSEGSDDWKGQYEAQLQSWRAQSAEARLKAEKERERWEAIRKVEKEEAARRGPEATVEEPSSAPQVSLSSSTTTTVEQPASLPDSQRWEDVHSSVTSSFPSMSFPGRTDSSSPARQTARPHSVPQTATMAIFDSSLSTKTRIKALLSSLAINMLLPFVNGVMLGFGEIFAKKLIIEQLGWASWRSSRPGSVAATTGLGSPHERRQKQTI
ncbi:hypothetical protein K443DRAFT_126907 [Laccaria amethystina LaAM-08-1]|uniref:Mitochondrial import protein 1 n=1 Tax=Laccaria amethystina LaAM-08-1 TaxID=1095629 RepID=A0A0C9Y7Y3_9AGAR|nr:hypothetical protein K443DRAFT_126907 [Laccaria amethystina LaAM-08-1]